MLQCQQITDDLVKQRADYLVRRGQELSVKTEVNPNLEEWFSNDPVERIVTLEAAITARKRELARTAGAGAGAGTRQLNGDTQSDDTDTSVTKPSHDTNHGRDKGKLAKRKKRRVTESDEGGWGSHIL